MLVYTEAFKKQFLSRNAQIEFIVLRTYCSNDRYVRSETFKTYTNFIKIVRCSKENLKKITERKKNRDYISNFKCFRVKQSLEGKNFRIFKKFFFFHEAINYFSIWNAFRWRDDKSM